MITPGIVDSLTDTLELGGFDGIYAGPDLSAAVIIYDFIGGVFEVNGVALPYTDMLTSERTFDADGMIIINDDPVAAVEMTPTVLAAMPASGFTVFFDGFVTNSGTGPTVLIFYKRDELDETNWVYQLKIKIYATTTGAQPYWSQVVQIEDYDYANSVFRYVEYTMRPTQIPSDHRIAVTAAADRLALAVDGATAVEDTTAVTPQAVIDRAIFAAEFGYETYAGYDGRDRAVAVFEPMTNAAMETLTSYPLPAYDGPSNSGALSFWDFVNRTWFDLDNPAPSDSIDAPFPVNVWSRRGKEHDPSWKASLFYSGNYNLLGAYDPEDPYQFTYGFTHYIEATADVVSGTLYCIKGGPGFTAQGFDNTWLFEVLLGDGQITVHEIKVDGDDVTLYERTCTVTLPTVAPFTMRLAITCVEERLSVSVNGGTVVTDTTTPVTFSTVANVIRMGGRPSDAFDTSVLCDFDGAISSLMCFSTIKADADLPALSALP